MNVSGERRFDAPRSTVWQVLNDPAAMAQTMPGVESFDVADDRHWKAHVKIPLGLGGMRMSVSFEKTEERAPEFAKLHAKGDGVGAIMNMVTSFHLSDADGGATTMRWEADVRIAGPVGSMGQRVLQPIVNQQVNHVLTALDKQVQEAARGAPAASAGWQEPPSSGSAGTPEPTTERPPPETDPQPKDSGPPAEGPADPEGTSGAEEGLNPWAPESYEPEGEGPTTSTED
jgi:carbon monoxide dehydrogenase subunit G